MFKTFFTTLTFLSGLSGLFTALMIPASFAQDADPCPTVELDQPGQAGAGLPIGDQLYHSSCFAFSSSFLGNVWAREIGSRHNPKLKSVITNPLVDYRNLLASPDLAQILNPEFGRTCQAFEAILKKRNWIEGNSKTAALTEKSHCSMWGLGDEDEDMLGLKSPEEFEAHLHELLTASARPLPFALEYCSSVFQEPEYDFIINRLFKKPLTYLNDAKEARNNFSVDCGFHSAVVVGQKQRGGVCYFKIRNSYGVHPSKNSNIEQGNYWIPAKGLSRNILRVIEIQ